MRIFLMSIVLGALMLFVIPDYTMAATGIVPCDGPDCQTCDFVELGTNILGWIIGIMATVCALVIMFAGFKMVMAGSNSGAISSAKEMIVNTLVGFVILLAAWLIVDTVMKTFVGDTIPGFGPWNEIKCVAQPEVAPEAPTGCAAAPDPAVCNCEATGGIWNTTEGKCEGATAPVAGACSIPALSPITDPQAQQMESGVKVIWTNDTLKKCVDKFIGKVGGGSVTSAYRPQAYQTHLWEIRDRWCTRGLQTNTTEACASLKASVLADASSHFNMSTWSCGAVAKTNSTHGSGIGVDISGPAHGSASVQKAASESCLIWRNYANDPVHYDLKSGCTCD